MTLIVSDLHHLQQLCVLSVLCWSVLRPPKVGQDLWSHRLHHCGHLLLSLHHVGGNFDKLALFTSTCRNVLIYEVLLVLYLVVVVVVVAVVFCVW